MVSSVDPSDFEPGRNFRAAQVQWYSAQKADLAMTEDPIFALAQEALEVLRSIQTEVFHTSELVERLKERKRGERSWPIGRTRGQGYRRRSIFPPIPARVTQTHRAGNPLRPSGGHRGPRAPFAAVGDVYGRRRCQDVRGQLNRCGIRWSASRHVQKMRC